MKAPIRMMFLQRLFLLILLLKVSLLPKVEVFLNLWYLKYCNLIGKLEIKKFLLTKSGC